MVWLIAGAVFFTCYFRFINIAALPTPSESSPESSTANPRAPGRFALQALATAVSGTVGVGNIVHVAVAISIGGPGTTFWLIVAGFLVMASKFVECSLGVKYRQASRHPVSGSLPVHYCLANRTIGASG